MVSESRFTEEVWLSWPDPFEVVRSLIAAGLDDREQAVNWLKGRLRAGSLRAGGWHVRVISDDPTDFRTETIVGLHKGRTWDRIAAIPWKDDFWVSGDFQPDDPLDMGWRTTERCEFQHYLTGIRFDPGPINEFCSKAANSVVDLGRPSIPSKQGSGGRPPKQFWDQLWASIAAQLYNGDLNPKRQADIERAMHDWLVSNDKKAGETAVRSRAKQLWEAIQSEVKN